MQMGFQAKAMDDVPAVAQALDMTTKKSCMLPSTDGTTPVLVYLEFSCNLVSSY